MNRNFDPKKKAAGTARANLAQPRLKPISAAVRATLLAAVLAQPVAWAAPTGGSIVQGQGTIGAPDANTVRVTQASDKLIVNWQGFGVGAGERVDFVQPSSSAVALNRVTGADPSLILGQLTANGQIFLINPNGVVFGQGAVVDVGGLVASTLDINDADFMAGRFVFSGDGGKVLNQGTLRAADSGYLVLAGREVSNEGVMLARLGTVALGAGRQATLDFTGDGLLHFAVDGAALEASVANKGLIQANGGQVILSTRAADELLRTVVNNEGLIEAKGLVSRGGVIRLEAADPVENNGVLGWQENLHKVQNANGIVVNSGTLDASAAESGAATGQVTLAGQRVGNSGQILARGADGTPGGRVLVTSTERTVVDAAGLIDTSGGNDSSAGNAVIWSDRDTYFYGTLLGKGGAAGGDGANVEVSGHKYLAFEGTVDLSAPQGKLGTLLLDPESIEIVGGGAQTHDACLDLDLGTAADCTGAVTSAVGHMGVGEAGGETAAAKLSEDKIQAIDANVHLTATKTIFVSGTFGGGDLVLMANRNLTLETRNAAGEAGGIDLTGVPVTIKTSGTGTITITAGTDGAATTYAKLGPMSTANQNITVTSKNGYITTAGAIDAGTGTVSFTTAEAAEATDGSIGLGADINASLIKLESVDGISQTAGKLTATDLVVRAAKGEAATVNLGSATNNIANLAATTLNAAMNFGYTDANALSVTTVDTINGITSGGGNVTLTTGDGAITVAQAIGAGAGTVSLTTAEAAEATDAGINLGADVSGGQIALRSVDGISQTAGKLTATNMVVRAAQGGDAAVTLGSTANDVANLAATNLGAVMTLSYTDANALSVATVDTINGITSGGGNVTLTTGDGAITVAQAIDAGAGTVSLTTAEAAEATAAGINLGADISGSLIKLYSVDGIGQSAGGLRATDLVVRAVKGDAASVTLGSTTNDVANLAATNLDAAMTFSYTDANALSVATVDTINGITSGGGNVTLATVDGALGTSQAIAAGAGTVSLTTGEAAEATAAGISVGADVSGSQITLVSVDGITQPAGRLTANGLAVYAAGGEAATVTLGGTTNDVVNLAASNIDAPMTFSYTDANALGIATVGMTNGIRSGGGNISLTARDGAISVAQAIAAGAGTVSLTTGEAAEATAAGISLGADLSGGRIALRSADGISQTAGRLAGTDLVVRAAQGDAATVTLGNTANDVANLAATGIDAAMTFSYTDANDLSVAALDGIDGIDTTADVSVASAAGTLRLGKVKGNNVSLNADGSILDANDDTAATINVTAMAETMLRATKGTVGTNSNGIEVDSRGKLSLYAGGHVSLVSGNINGQVLGNVLYPLNVAPGLLILNGKVVGGGLMDSANSGRFGTITQLSFLDDLLVPRPAAHNAARHYPTAGVTQEMAFAPAAPTVLPAFWNTVESGTRLPAGVGAAPSTPAAPAKADE